MKIIRFLAALVGLLFIGPAFAALNATQLATLKADIQSRQATTFPTLNPSNPDDAFTIAAWYNATAQTGEYATPLKVWKPVVTITEANSVIDWAGSPAGAAAADVTNGWLKWQSMFWSNAIDMTDAQVRQGINSVWGSGSTTATGLLNVGKKDCTRLECLLSGSGVGGARVSQVFGQKVTYQEIVAAFAT